VKRILGIDPGEKRVGLAISDPMGITAQGLDTFIGGTGEAFFEHLGRLIKEYDVESVVIGMPLSMSGGKIEGTEKAERLAEKISARFDVSVILRDERMSSLEAERHLSNSRKGFVKGDIDRISAIFILQSYLDEIADKNH